MFNYDFTSLLDQVYLQLIVLWWRSLTIQIIVNTKQPEENMQNDSDHRICLGGGQNMPGVEGTSTILISPRIRGTFSLFSSFIWIHSLPSTELRRSRPSRRRSGAAGRGRCPGREPSSGNYGASGGTRRTKRTCGAPVKTCCSSPFRANFRRMREFCSEKVCFPVTRLSAQSHANPGSVFLIPLCYPTANFKRPIVIMGPLNDIAMEKLAREMPDEYEAAGWCRPLFNLYYYYFEFVFFSIIYFLFLIWCNIILFF